MTSVWAGLALENYYNYFTEIEECFQRVRGTPTLLSTLDWALIESWKEAGIPLEAVRSGIERTFEKFAKKGHRFRKVNGLGYCTQEVMVAAEEMKTAKVEGGNGSAVHPSNLPFTAEEVLRYLEDGISRLGSAADQARKNSNFDLAKDFDQAASDLQMIAAQTGEAVLKDLQGLERQLTVLEERLTASLTRSCSVDLLTRMHEEAERGMAPFRRTMNAAQIESLERQFIKKKLFEYHQLPRLSLFYL